MFTGEENKKKIDCTTDLNKSSMMLDVMELEFDSDCFEKEPKQLIHDIKCNSRELSPSRSPQPADDEPSKMGNDTNDIVDNSEREPKHLIYGNSNQLSELNLFSPSDAHHSKDSAANMCNNNMELEEDSENSPQLWKCPKCNAMFCEKDSCSQHFEEAHIFVCGLCKEPCDDKTSLELHIIDHIALEPGEPLQKIKRSSFIDSYTQTDVKVEEPFQPSDSALKLFKRNISTCKKCPTTSKIRHSDVYTTSASDDDIEFLLEKEEPQNKCEACEKCYFSESALLLHMKNKHEDMPVKTFHRCDKCNMFFQWKLCLTRHQILKHGKNKEKLKLHCKLCSDVFETQKEYNNHKKTHLDDNPFICDFCDNVFDCSAKHLQHIKNAHPHSREFPCTICGKSFKSKMFLNAHSMEVHSYHMNAKCQVSKKAIKIPRAIEKHVLIDHDSERKKKFTCGYCGKKLLHGGMMMQHVQTHQEAK